MIMKNSLTFCKLLFFAWTMCKNLFLVCQSMLAPREKVEDNKRFSWSIVARFFRDGAVINKNRIFSSRWTIMLQMNAFLPVACSAWNFLSQISCFKEILFSFFSSSHALRRENFSLPSENEKQKNSFRLTFQGVGEEREKWGEKREMLEHRIFA